MGYTLYITKFHDSPVEVETRALVSITKADARKDLYTELVKANTELQTEWIKGFELRLIRWDTIIGKDIEVMAKLKGGSDE